MGDSIGGVDPPGFNLLHLLLGLGSQVGDNIFWPAIVLLFKFDDIDSVLGDDGLDVEHIFIDVDASLDTQ
jgi:hypothetical protein